MNENNFIASTILNCSRTFLRVNPYTEQLYILKYLGKFYANSQTPHSCAEFVDSVLQKNIIFDEDRWKFDDLKYPQALVKYYTTQKNSTSRMFRRIENKNLVWSRLDIMIPDNHSSDFPDILLSVRDVDTMDAATYDSFTTYTQKLYKIFKVSFQTNVIQMIQEPYSERTVRQKSDVRNYQQEVQFTCEKYVHPEDKNEFLRSHDSKEIIQIFSEGNQDYTFYYRRKLGNLYHWVRVIVLPVTRKADPTQSFYFYVEDVHRDTIQLLDLQNLKTFSKYYGGLSKENIDAYYSNVMTVLYSFTQSYVDFYMVNLEKDLYIKYKFQSGTLHEAIPNVAPYSQSSLKYIKDHCSGQQAEMLSLYATSEKLREAMRDRLTLEYEFYSDEGVKLRTICQKVESVNGTPTKLICRTIICHDENQLTIKTFGNFEALSADGKPIRFTRKQSKQLLAYLVDRQGYPITNKDIIADILEKPENDLNAIKYCSTLIRRTMTDLENAGYPNVIVREQKTLRIDTSAVDCDYYHLLKGELSYLLLYHNEYMKEYSWAESTNAEILSIVEI